jgi:sugar phosphate permease
MALGASGSFGVVGMTAVTNWFLRKRTLALGILATGTGFSGALVPVLHWSILHYGWRATLIFSGLGVWAVGLPMSILVRDVPEKYGMLPDGEIFPAGAPESNNPKTGEGLPPKEENTGYTAWTILRVRAFWLIALSVGISMAGFHAIAAVGFPYFLEIGMSASIAGWTILLLTAVSILGRLGFGWLGDHMDKRKVMAIIFLLQFIGGIWFALTREPWHLIPFLLTFGPAFGVLIPLRPAIQGEFFGRHAFGSILGIMFVFITVGAMISPVFTCWVFDTWGSYRHAFLILAALNLICIPMIMRARKPETLAGTRSS